MVTITDDDAGPGTLQLSAASYTVAENGVTLTVTVERVGGSTGAVSVDYATVDGSSPRPDSTTSPRSGTLTFADAETTATFDITIVDDIVYEGDKTFSVSLSNATGAHTRHAGERGGHHHRGRSARSPPAHRSATYSVAENGGTVTVTVDRVGGSVGAVSVDYATADGTATAGLDYTAASWHPHLCRRRCSLSDLHITILDDTDYEGDETFSVSLSNATGGATLGTPTSAVVTIIETIHRSISHRSPTTTSRRRRGTPR